MSDLTTIAEHVDGLEKALRNLEPDLVSAADADALVHEFSRGEKLCASGRTLLARLVADPAALAQAAGITESEAATNVRASRTAADQPALEAALRSGQFSTDQAHAVAHGAEADPSALDDLLGAAATQSVRELREVSRRVALAAKEPDDLYARQRRARSWRRWRDDLGMVCGSYRLPPDVGAGVEAAIEREAKRAWRTHRRAGGTDTYENVMADAFAGLITAGPRAGRASRAGAEVVIDVTYDALLRGATRRGETCDVRGVGPIPVSRAREIMDDAFLKALVTDGTDVRLVKHFGRHIPAEVKTALGWRWPACVDCGSRFHLEADHVDPYANGGPTSYDNLRPRCWQCHQRKTDDDRRRGVLPPRRRRDEPR